MHKSLFSSPARQRRVLVLLIVFVLALLVALNAPQVARAEPRVADEREFVIGSSQGGRAIVAERFGTPGGPVVLLVGLIHGDEKGSNPVLTSVRRDLIANGSPADVWIIRTASPDGAASHLRENSRGVDLNRNFPTSDWQRTPRGRNFSGPSAASESETRALVSFVKTYRPVLSIWFHQVGPMVDPHPLGDLRIMRRFAAVAGYPLVSAPCSGVCAGTATTFHAETVPGATAFVVELPAKVTPSHVERNRLAVRAVLRLLTK
jgi:protein MpaA